MLVLDTTTKSITVAMSGAPATTNPDFVTAYSDDNGTTFVEGASDGALNGTSQVTLVTSPAAATRRLIKTIYIENKDTAPVTIIVTYNNNGTLRNIAKVTLSVGDTWSTDGTTDAYGNLKSTGSSGYSGYSGFSGFSGANGVSGYSGFSGYSGSGISGYSGYSGSGISGYSGYSGYSGSMTYPGAGIANSTGSAWGTSYSTSGSGTVVALATNPTVTNYTETAYTANTSTAITVALTNGTVQILTLTGNATITMPTAAAGKSFIIMLKTGAGGYTTTWSTVSWPGGTAPTVTSTASKTDIYSFFSDGTSWFGTTIGQAY
jgi:collagen type VII alpha